MKNQPKYQHDCDTCLFLGRFENYDLYYHPGSDWNETLVARYGNDPEDYVSGLTPSRTFAVVNGVQLEPDPALAHARSLAEARGLLAE